MQIQDGQTDIGISLLYIDLTNYSNKQDMHNMLIIWLLQKSQQLVSPW